MRLIRTILVLAGAGVLMPSPPEDLAARTPEQTASDVSAMEMLSSATSTFSDIADFCVRQPGACETAAYVAARFEAKAKYSAKLIYEWATDQQQMPEMQTVPVEADTSDELQTGSTRAILAESVAATGQSTLRLDDLIPAWRGPSQPKKKG